MLYIPKINGYLKILAEEEVKDFAAIIFTEYFKTIKEEQYLRKVAKLLDIYLATPHEVEKYAQSNSFDNCVPNYVVEN